MQRLEIVPVLLLTLLLAGPRDVAAEGAAEGAVEAACEAVDLATATEADGFQVEPGADLGSYRQAAVVAPEVAFRPGWRRDQNRTSIHRITAADAQRLERDFSKLVQKVFSRHLAGEGGFEIVDGADPGTLVVCPVIVDLDLSAPDLADNARSRTFADSTGKATLVLELRDAANGARLARYLDRAVADHPVDELRWSNQATNRAAQKRMIAGWADELTAEIDQLRDRDRS